MSNIKKTTFVLVLSLVAFYARPSLAADTPRYGSNINISGTIYFLDKTSQTKRPYTSAGDFLSFGYNKFSDVLTPTQTETDLPTGTFVRPLNGSLINDHGTVYLISDGLKAGFTTPQVFLGLGYSWANVLPGDASFLDALPPIDTDQQPHLPGTLINDSGTVFLLADAGRIGITSADIFNSWGYSFDHVVKANSFDLQDQSVGFMPYKSDQPDKLEPVPVQTPPAPINPFPGPVSPEPNVPINPTPTPSPTPTPTPTPPPPPPVNNIGPPPPPPPPAPTITSFTATPDTITAGSGQNSTLTWNTANTTSVSISPINYSSTQASGAVTVAPTSTTTYVIVATGPGGTNQTGVTLTVNPATPPPPPPVLTGTVITDFDNPTPGVANSGLINGVFRGIDWGTGNWRWSSTFGPDSTGHAYFDSSAGNSRTFTFSSPSVLHSMNIFSSPTVGTITLSDDVGQTFSESGIGPNTMTTINTGWTMASNTVLVQFTAGWDLGIDDLNFTITP